MGPRESLVREETKGRGDKKVPAKESLRLARGPGPNPARGPG